MAPFAFIPSKFTVYDKKSDSILVNDAPSGMCGVVFEIEEQQQPE